MGFFSRLFGLEKNNKQDQIQRRKQSTKSKSKTYPLNEVGVIGKFSDDAYDKKNSSVVHDLNGKRIFKIPVTARTRAFENENYLGRKTFKSGTVRWVDIDKDEVNKALEEKGVAVEMHIYPNGGHGYGLGIGMGYLQKWPNRLKDWLSDIK